MDQRDICMLMQVTANIPEDKTHYMSDLTSAHAAVLNKRYLYDPIQASLEKKEVSS